jgi:ABC-type transport system involved in multi-copper enzyme maturation permease subunit
MSPVHDQTYRRYAGQRAPTGRAWLVILRAGVRALLRRKVFIALLLLAWLPFIVRTVQIYAVVTYPQARQVIPVNAALFQSFVEFQGIFAFFITVYAGAGLVASDRRANALQVYLSKPLGRLEYVAGKFGVLFVYLAAVTILPALLLLLVQMMLAGNADLLTSEPRLVPALLLASLLRIIVPATTMIALSSLSNSPRYVALMYTGVLFFSEAMYGVLTFITGSTRVAWVSISRDFEVLTDVFFGHPARYETPPLVAALVLAGLVAVAVSVIERRVRGVEVVS